ncbi:hypothetical protein [Oceanicola sp. 502str15]|uniref:hypothetical protein n=1 Tax=Oceanicola sp. 502str15 TaxID=2696061 RepID=UPI002094CAA4|nr:hypothetical protein [Oceanicola sp. 502str15]MCO6383961.1 hypothetical protein [Oceanicola sp. 502str15]
MTDWGDLAERAAEEAGCFGRCPDHPDQRLTLWVPDEVAAEREQRAWVAFASAVQASGFDGNPDSLQGDLIFVLQSVDEACPICGAAAQPSCA